MEKLWAGRFSKELDQTADDFNSSILFDSRMYRQDIQGSIEHAAMLAKQNIISSDDCRQIVSELLRIQKELEEGTLSIDPNAEDIHMFIESVLTKRIGDAGKRLHTARSRNDQVALDLRLYLREECETILSLIRSLVDAIVEKAQDNLVALLPGYTHLQRAQPISFAHHLLAYGMMFSRDISRLQDAVKRMNVSP
ncbi:MAG TPA: argininosuccinate lyase, partial [Clostridiales bacterium]|nr:argininosuccinate lyase [Clostridiales bacterium]